MGCFNDDLLVERLYFSETIWLLFEVKKRILHVMCNMYNNICET